MPAELLTARRAGVTPSRLRLDLAGETAVDLASAAEDDEPLLARAANAVAVARHLGEVAQRTR